MLLSALGVVSMARGQEAGSSAIIDRIGDTGFLRVDVDGFGGLDAHQQQLAYWLAQAAIAIDPIVYDQFSRFGLRQKRLLEGIVAFTGADPANRKLVEFARLFWANRGNHNLNIQVQDYQKMRQGVGLLLAELMRIKGEGDYRAIKALVDQYAVHFDMALRDQIVARYRRLDQPTYRAGIFARLTAQTGPDGSVQAVHLSYPRSVDEQYLNFAAMFFSSMTGSLAAWFRRESAPGIGITRSHGGLQRHNRIGRCPAISTAL